MGQFEEDTAAANKLFVEEVKLVNSAENVDNPHRFIWLTREKMDALQKAERSLIKIIDRYPSIDLAVKLISGQNVGSVSLEGVRSAAKEAQEEMERAEFLVG